MTKVASSGFSRQNLLTENSNQLNSMSQFASPTSVNLSNSSGPSQFSGNDERWINRRNGPKDGGRSELKEQNLKAESNNSSVNPPLPSKGSFNNNNVGNVRMQQPSQLEKSPG